MPWYIGVAGCLGVIVGNVLGFGLIVGAMMLWDKRKSIRTRIRKNRVKALGTFERTITLRRPENFSERRTRRYRPD